MSGENIVVIPEGCISGQEAANLTGYAVRYLRKLARENRLRATKLGRDWLFERESLLKWKEQMDELGTKKHSPRTKKPTKLESLNLQESRPRVVLEDSGPASEAGTYPPPTCIMSTIPD